jgi:hypothetical protein
LQILEVSISKEAGITIEEQNPKTMRSRYLKATSQLGAKIGLAEGEKVADVTSSISQKLWNFVEKDCANQISELRKIIDQ